MFENKEIRLRNDKFELRLAPEIGGSIAARRDLNPGSKAPQSGVFIGYLRRSSRLRRSISATASSRPFSVRTD